MLVRIQPVVSAFRTGQRLTGQQLDGLVRDLAAIDQGLHMYHQLLTTGNSATGYGLKIVISYRTPQLQGIKLVAAREPEYPPLARQARIQGIVRFTVVVGTNGSVERAALKSGHPLLVESARDAVLQYRFAPPPAPVTTDVDVNFVL